jgi:hypothetical protein
MLSRHVCFRAIPRSTSYFIHTFAPKRSIAATQEKSRSNLNVIDFFHPSLSSTLFQYTLNFGVSGYPKRGKPCEPMDEQAVYSSVQVGDDAYFKRHDALGVADGVGGWRTHKGKVI